MFQSRALASLLATLILLASPFAHAQIGIQRIPDQTVPSGKTLVIPIPATDPGGPARSYTVTTGAPTLSGTDTPTSVAGFTAAIRTGDPHFILGVSYTDSNSVMQTGTMEFQLLRELTPNTTKIISGLTQGGFYNPQTTGTNPTKFITFHRIVPGFVIQGGDPNGNGTGGPGFSFENEFSRALIFSGTLGQLAMANSDTRSATQGISPDNGDTNGSQFFITLSSDRTALDYGFNLFGQILRGYDTLEGIAGTPLLTDTSTGETTSSPASPVDITSATISQNNTDAVLLLSATGVCDAVITVTASSGGSSVVQTFTAHALADSLSDPPFPQPPPSVASPNGSVKVTLQANDLQLDLIRYGYQRFLPANDGGVTSGTSPIISIPLISNTDNLIGAEFDSWNGSTRGFEGFPFHVGAGVKPLSGTLTAIPNGSGGSLNLASYPVAVFSSPNPKDTTAASFTATVNWGDGTPLLTSTGGTATVVKDGAGRFKLMGKHDYLAPGEFPILVNIADTGGARLALSGTANIGPSAIVMTSYDIVNKGGNLKNQLLATFADNGQPATPADYAATVNWGDGAVTSGTVKSAPNSSFQILGSHLYQTADTFTVCASVVRTGTYSASSFAAARISGATPSPLPPFSQIHLAQIWSTIYSDSNAILSTGSSGGNPFSALVQGSDGNFYGTTRNGGGSGVGTVFQITSSGSLTTLYSFTGGGDGGNPTSALVEGTNGFFYGTTGTNGSGGSGTVYSITPGGSVNVLYSFTGGDDGGNPYAGLVTGTDGNFYGTTETDGAHEVGTIFRISYSGSLDTLYSFTGGADGGNPFASLITGTDGNLYGTAVTGGTGGGTAYSITYKGAFNTLHAFDNEGEGGSPYGGLVSGTDGNFYGTTAAQGAYTQGTIFRLSYGGSLQTLYAFTGGGDGGNPRAPLISAPDGNLYGTTVAGGDGFGALFNISYDGAFNSLYAFSGGSDGAEPYAPVITGTDGNFYGTTEAGGNNQFGTVFQWIPPSGPLTTLAAFTSGTGFQISLRASVAIVNSGNKPLLSGSGFFSAYVDPNGALDGNQTIFSSNGQTSFAIPALQPGAYHIFTFYLEGSVVDSRLKLPINFDPSGQKIIGVVTYSDPVGDFDGSEKVISPGSF
jgi:uncharacterized repeat protein (TIGR03803 family)